jgi:hypothetical protein
LDSERFGNHPMLLTGETTMATAIVNESLKAGETATAHKFELAGLGKAPFHFTGVVTEKTYQACQGAPVQPGSSCDYCSTGIRYEFWVRSADGHEFKVGCDCIHKTGDRGLVQQISAAERELRKKKNTAAKERKIARIATRVAAAKEKLPLVRGTLSSQPHPSKYFADQGKTLLDYVIWCLDNGAGEKAAFIIEKA